MPNMIILCYIFIPYTYQIYDQTVEGQLLYERSSERDHPRKY